jgi:hypothetical protein
MKGTCTNLVLSLQFGTEMNWLHFSIELSVAIYDSCSVHHRLDVIDIFTNCLHAIDSNGNEILVTISIVW